MAHVPMAVIISVIFDARSYLINCLKFVKVT